MFLLVVINIIPDDLTTGLIYRKDRKEKIDWLLLLTHGTYRRGKIGTRESVTICLYSLVGV